jgi:tetratricopeptide (TPR) repeat protein
MSAKSPASTRDRLNHSAVSNGAWVHHPAIDLIVGCGAWSALLLLLAYPFGSGNRLFVSTAFYGLALVFNYPHFMATIYRAYGSRQDFSRYRVFTLHITILLLVTLAVAHWAYSSIALIFTIYITWSPWHYTGQNFGLAMMFCRRNGITISKSVRNTFFTAFIASYGLILVSFHTGPSGDPYVLSLGLTESLRTVVTLPLVIIFLSLGIWSLVAMIRQKGTRAATGPLVLFSTQFLWFVAPVVLQVIAGVEIPQTRYSTGVLAVMHAAQYMWITSYFTKRDAESAGRKWSMAGYFGTLVVGGIALFIPGPWLVSYVFRFDFVASFLIFTAVVNIHHFILDGVMWKLREGRIASILVSKLQRTPGTPPSKSALQPARRRTPVLRLLRILVFASLLLLAGLDLTKFYLGLDAQSGDRLARAEALNPYDQPLLVKKARAQAKSGELEKTIETLERAIAVNVHNSEPQNLLAKVLIDNQLYERAYHHYLRMLEHHPRDVNALINRGVIANKLEKDDDAIESWKRALAIDPDQQHLHLYLAQIYDRRDQPQAAIPHYEQYLAALGEQATEGRLNLKEVLSITLRLAQVYGRDSQFERAITYSERSYQLSTQSGEIAASALALSLMGDSYEGMGRNHEAIKCYQRGLILDAQSGDPEQRGMDWFNYSQFLRRHKQSNQLVLACLLKAEELLAPVKGVGLDTIVATRQEIVQRLGQESAIVRRDLEALVKKALSEELQNYNP